MEQGADLGVLRFERLRASDDGAEVTCRAIPVPTGRSGAQGAVAPHRGHAGWRGARPLGCSGSRLLARNPSQTCAAAAAVPAKRTADATCFAFHATSRTDFPGSMAATLM